MNELYLDKSGMDFSDKSTSDIRSDSPNTSSRRTIFISYIKEDESSSEDDKERIYQFESQKLQRKNDEEIIKRNYVESQIDVENTTEDLVRNLEERLAFFDSIAGDDYTFIEKNMIDIEKNHSMKMLGDVIQTIYIRNFDNSSIMAGICKALMRYDIEEVTPWGPTMLAGLINHPSEMVKEYVVELIDNWDDKELLPILSTIEIKSKWLTNYINDVVDRLEKDVLSKKVV